MPKTQSAHMRKLPMVIYRNSKTKKLKRGFFFVLIHWIFMNIRIMIHEFSQTKIVIRINSNNSKNTIFVIQMNRIFKIHANRFTIHHSNRSPSKGVYCLQMFTCFWYTCSSWRVKKIHVSGINKMFGCKIGCTLKILRLITKELIKLF